VPITTGDPRPPITVEQDMSSTTVPKHPPRPEQVTGRPDSIVTIGAVSPLMMPALMMPPLMVPPLMIDGIVTVRHSEPAAAR
jgi:hypothetical protein